MPFDGTELSETTQGLIKGRARIEAGWIQEGLRSREGVCIVGAISLYPDGLRLIQQVIGDVPIYRYNDAPERTKEEVLEVYDRAIVLSLNERA